VAQAIGNWLEEFRVLTSLEYSPYPRAVSKERLERYAWGSTGLCVFELPWFFMGTLGFYFLAPGSWHYAVYDYSVFACLLCLVLALPAMLGLISGLLVIVKHRAAGGTRFSLILACVGVGLSFAAIAWILKVTVISPANPYAPGYWI
jgi:hypothetical protein